MSNYRSSPEKTQSFDYLNSLMWLLDMIEYEGLEADIN